MISFSQIRFEQNSFQITTMSIIPFRNLRFILCTCRRLRAFEQTQRCTITVTDEYRATASRSRSSLKGVELLRNPALNKVIEKLSFSRRSAKHHFLSCQS